jgi:hypothetical protein
MTQEKKAFHAVLARSIENIHLNAKVVAQEIYRVGVIGEDAAHLGRSKNHVPRLAFRKRMRKIVDGSSDRVQPRYVPPDS